MNHLSNINNLLLLNNIKKDMDLALQGIWYQKLAQESAVRGSGHNKLCTLKHLKSIETEVYAKDFVSKRASLAKFHVFEPHLFT